MIHPSSLRPPRAWLAQLWGRPVSDTEWQEHLKELAALRRRPVPWSPGGDYWPGEPRVDQRFDRDDGYEKTWINL